VAVCLPEKQSRCSEKRLVSRRREIRGGGSFGRDVMLQTVRGQTTAVTGRDDVAEWLQIFIIIYL
jgi:hypothetical protein